MLAIVEICLEFVRITKVKVLISLEEWKRIMANTEVQYLKNEIKQLKADMANLIMALIELKIFKIKIDEDGNAIYDTGKDGK
jgi:hypothetical protein